MYGQYYNPVSRLAQYEQSFPQTIQTLQGVQPQVQCYFVSSPSDISNIQIQPSTVYIGLNESAQEIYLRQWNNDGNIDFKTYKLLSGTQEQTDMKAIALALEEIKEYMKGGSSESSITTIGSTVNVGNRTEQSDVGRI